jgi:hypothetical protein
MHTSGVLFCNQLSFQGGNMKNLILVTMILLGASTIAQAAKPRYYVPTTNKSYSYTTMNNMGSDQERCQAESNHMAANNITGHVWGTIGGFEGVGYGNGPNCNTCTPSGRMSLTGDASAQGRNGMWYRVRSWR